MSELNELELECGVILQLKPGKQMIALEFINKFGGLDGIMRGDVSSIAATAGSETIDGFVKLINYFSGWCVVNDVPQNVREEFSMLASSERALRSLWVRDIMTVDEVSQFFAQVMALMFQPNGDGPQSAEALQARVTELEGKLKEE